MGVKKKWKLAYKKIYHTFTSSLKFDKQGEKVRLKEKKTWSMSSLSLLDDKKKIVTEENNIISDS